MRPERIAGIHLDPLGGIAGDMFAACLLDAFPGLEAGLRAALAKAGLPPNVRLERIAHRDHALTGSRIVVTVSGAAPPSGKHREIAARIMSAELAPAVREHALGIYRQLAEAEAQVHGVPVGDVHFHELADWDSYVDILAAAWLIAELAPESWSCAPLPLGSGRVRTQHGALPVPAPATALLLRDLPTMDDSVPGERVTPTGAAILAHLRPTLTRSAGQIAATGHGFGTRVLDGVPNLLRALVLAPGQTGAQAIGVLRFEIDDQTPEDLAIGLEHLRGLPAVLDVCQWPAFGKKGRMMMAVQVLCEAAAIAGVADACLSETSTIGLRWRVEQRRVLPREQVEVDAARVKRVVRPDGGRTVKLEADELDGAYAARRRQRAEAERR